MVAGVERETILEVSRLQKRFGGLHAVNHVSFAVGKGEIVGLIGPNGAGKTTCFNVITGVQAASGGSVTLCGIDITSKRTSSISKLGMVRTFQATTLFKDETVLENVLRGGLMKEGGALRSPWRLFLTAGVSVEAESRADGILSTVDLSEERDSLAGALSYGKQKRLGVAMALAAEPQMLLLDEPAAGLNPEESVAMARLIRHMRDTRGISVLLVEHDMKLIMGICDRIIVLEHGQQIATGTPAEVRSNPDVIEAYLGSEVIDS